MESRPRVMVLIVAYHGASWIPLCLETLVRASRERLAVCLVDNSGNGDAIPKSCPEFEYRVVHTPRPLGFSEANNFGLKEAGLDKEFVCFLNQDTRSLPGWLDACLAGFDCDPALGAASPLLRTYDDSDWDPGFLDCRETSTEFWNAINSGKPLAPLYVVPRVTAAAMVIRTSVLKQVGPFDPIFGSYYEDYDLCRRIREAGFHLGLVTSGKVCHHSGSATTSYELQRKRMRQIVRNRTILRIREAGAHRWRAILRYCTCVFPYNLGRSMLRTSSSQPLPIQLSAHWDLLAQWRRLISERHDRRAWSEYLRGIGWPGESPLGAGGPSA